MLKTRIVQLIILANILAVITTAFATSINGEIFSKVKDKLVIVQCDDIVGSGFVVEMEEGKKYFVTNKHVVNGQKRVSAILLNGKELTLGAFEVAENRDLVRFLLPQDRSALRIFEGEPDTGTTVYIFGNSDGGMVATDLSGTILGVGPENIEVDVKFVQGNSGSAVLNNKGEVIGVATFATLDDDPQNWVKKDSRFGQVRRFAVRFTGIKWQPMKYEVFYKKCIARQIESQRAHGILPQVTAKFSNPKMLYYPWFPHGHGTIARSYGFAIGSVITLRMSGGGDIIKNPIIRIAIVVQGIDGRLYMSDCILDRPGHTCESPPIYQYGNESSGRTFPAANNSVYWLEGLSYYQGMFPPKSQRSGIKYFEKANECELFIVKPEICGPKPPKIICYRFECWQNGALAGYYNSLGPTTLNSRKLPVDWFTKDKYPDIFVYRKVYFVTKEFR